MQTKTHVSYTSRRKQSGRSHIFSYMHASMHACIYPVYVHQDQIKARVLITLLHTHTHTYITYMHACINTHIHTYIHTYTYTAYMCLKTKSRRCSHSYGMQIGGNFSLLWLPQRYECTHTHMHAQKHIQCTRTYH